MVKKKKVKQKPKTIKRIEKTVVQHCFWISDFEEIRKIAKRYKDVKNYVYSRYSGINSLLTIRNHRKEIRNLWVKNKFAEQWKLPARYWKLALDESIANIKSNWSNTKNAVRKLVRYNEHLTDEEKQYIFYVLKADKILYSILRRELFVPTEKLKQLKVREKYIHNLIRRYIRKCKGSIPYSNRETSFMIDRPMYKYKDENTIEIASTVFGKRIQLQLQDSNIYSGNIRVVIKDNKIELHHCVRTKEKKIWQEENIVGIDKGYRHLLVTSSGHLYGVKSV